MKILQNSQENTFGLQNFQKHLFVQNSCGRLLLLLAFQKGCSKKKSCFWKFHKIHRKTALVCGIRKSSFFTEHLRMTASAFSFSEATTEALYEKDVLENFTNFTEKRLWLAKFSKTPFFTEHLWMTASGFFTFFSCQFLKITKFLVFLNDKKKTIFNDSFDLIIFIFQQGKSLMMEREFLAEVV